MYHLVPSQYAGLLYPTPVRKIWAPVGVPVKDLAVEDDIFIGTSHLPTNTLPPTPTPPVTTNAPVLVLVALPVLLKTIAWLVTVVASPVNATLHLLYGPPAPVLGCIVSVLIVQFVGIESYFILVNTTFFADDRVRHFLK